MSASQQGGAQGHEVRDCVIAIADQLVQDRGDESKRLGMVEPDTAGEALLGEGAGGGDEEFVYLCAAGPRVSE